MTSDSIGSQATPSRFLDHSSHTAFMNMARQYQESVVRQWAKQLGVDCIWDERPHHGVWLKDEYARLGLVFYEGFRDDILRLYYSGRTKIGMNLLRNALRSEHIPYNLFFPMMKKQNKLATKNFFNELLGTDAIADVIDVKIEYSPQPKYNYLNDGTSFDAYVLYRHKDGSKGAVGIEVKYTEREYSIGETEYGNTHDLSGNVRLAQHYERATHNSGYYLPNNEEALVSDNLRQIWRNHILGASMVLNGDIEHFSSLTVFPDANPHFHEASEEYRQMLTEKGKSTFFTKTYEEMFEAMTHYFNTRSQLSWIRYLYDRYLFGADMPEVEAVEATPEQNSLENGEQKDQSLLNQAQTTMIEQDQIKQSPVHSSSTTSKGSNQLIIILITAIIIILLYWLS